MKKIILVLLLAILVYALSYAWRALPIITGYNAKMMCSCTMLASRSPESVMNDELSRFPLSLASPEVNFNDSTVSCSVWGLASKKAVYKKGLGCTLLNGITEKEFRNQQKTVATPSSLNRDTIPWPMGDLMPDSLPPTIDYEALQQIVNSAFDEPGPKRLRRTRAILVVYDGSIVAEKYADGFDKNSRLIGWSMTKSIINALVGILVKEGKLALDAPAPIPFWQQDERSKITLSNLLHASSGLRWEEDYSAPSGATNMLFKEKDMGLYAAHCPAQYPPETVFYYSGGTTNILSWIVRQAVGEENYYRFPSEELFQKLGIRSMVIEPDAGGTFVGSSYSFATARDWARFGLLYLYDGNWYGEQLLPDDWVHYTTTPAPAAPRGEYGAQFWLNAGAKEDPANRYYPDAPTDLYWADGFEGQNVFILPSRKLVIVKLSMSHGDYLDDNAFLKEVIRCVGG